MRGETAWNKDSPGLAETPLSQIRPASSANPIPLRLHRARRQASSVAGNRSRTATRRGTAPWRSRSSCSLAEEEKSATSPLHGGFRNEVTGPVQGNKAVGTHGCRGTCGRRLWRRKEVVLGLRWSAATARPQPDLRPRNLCRRPLRTTERDGGDAVVASGGERRRRSNRKQRRTHILWPVRPPV